MDAAGERLGKHGEVFIREGLRVAALDHDVLGIDEAHHGKEQLGGLFGKQAQLGQIALRFAPGECRQRFGGSVGQAQSVRERAQTQLLVKGQAVLVVEMPRVAGGVIQAVEQRIVVLSLKLHRNVSVQVL